MKFNNNKKFSIFSYKVYKPQDKKRLIFSKKNQHYLLNS